MTPFIARNHYEMLQVGRNATAAELTRAFRKLAKEYHPDVAQQQFTAATAFHRIRESYEVLSNPEKRREYDLRLTKIRGRAAAPTNGRRATATRPRPRRAQAPNPRPKPPPRTLKHNPALDLEASIPVSLTRIFSGGEQSVDLDKAPGADFPVRSRSVKATIPPLCVEGSWITLPLYGRLNKFRGEAGHLKLKVEYAPYDGFQIRGPHLYTSIMIFPWDAAMGVTIPIKSPEGTTPFEIPAGTHQWRTFCLPGKGLPQQDGGRGNLYIYVKIQSVAARSERQRNLWKALKESYQSGENAS